MSKRSRYIIYVVLIAFAWLSQLLFPDESFIEPLAWTGFILVIGTIIEISQR